MPTITVRHERGDRFAIGIRDHGLIVDQPDGPWGQDEGPTPTELFVAGLASCAGFYAERFLRRHDLAVDGLGVVCRYEMSEDRPARVRSIELLVECSTDLTFRQLEALRRVVEHCTVHNSIQIPPRIETSVTPGRRAA
jgi:putative redox protein